MNVSFVQEHGLLTVKEAATVLKTSSSWVLKEIQRGKIPATKHGRDWELRAQDVAAYALKVRRRGRPPNNRPTESS